jgi:hypothetical protein
MVRLFQIQNYFPIYNYVEIVPPETAQQADKLKQSSHPKQRQQHGLKTRANTCRKGFAAAQP